MEGLCVFLYPRIPSDIYKAVCTFTAAPVQEAEEDDGRDPDVGFERWE